MADLVIAVLGFLGANALFYLTFKQREHLDAPARVLRFGYAVLGCGLMIQFGISTIRFMELHPVFHPKIWMVKDIGIALIVIGRVWTSQRHGYVFRTHTGTP